MKSMKLFYTVVGGVAALGIVLMGVGFALGGFDPRVFTMSINAATGQVVLGGKEVARYEGIPLIGDLMSLGMVDTDPDADADDVAAPSAPAAPAAPEAPEAPAAPAAPSAPSEQARIAIPADPVRSVEDAPLVAEQALLEKAVGWWSALMGA